MAEKELKSEIVKQGKEIDADTIQQKRELFRLKQEIEATQAKLEKNQKNLEALSKEKTMYLDTSRLGMRSY